MTTNVCLAVLFVGVVLREPDMMAASASHLSADEHAALQQAVLRLRGYALLVPSLFPAKANHAQGQS